MRRHWQRLWDGGDGRGGEGGSGDWGGGDGGGAGEGGDEGIEAERERATEAAGTGHKAPLVGGGEGLASGEGGSDEGCGGKGDGKGTPLCRHGESNPEPCRPSGRRNSTSAAATVSSQLSPLASCAVRLFDATVILLSGCCLFFEACR